MYKWRELTKSYAEYLAIIFFLESMDKKEDGLKPVLHKLFCLYGLWSLDQHLVELYQGGYSQVRCCVNYIVQYINHAFCFLKRYKNMYRKIGIN